MPISWAVRLHHPHPYRLCMAACDDDDNDNAVAVYYGEKNNVQRLKCPTEEYVYINLKFFRCYSIPKADRTAE